MAFVQARPVTPRCPLGLQILAVPASPPAVMAAAYVAAAVRQAETTASPPDVEMYAGWKYFRKKMGFPWLERSPVDQRTQLATSPGAGALPANVPDPVRVPVWAPV